MTKLYGLLGEHLSHSLSPVIHSKIFQKLSMEGYYDLFEVKPMEVKKAVESFDLLKFRGVNVTIPYKQKIMEHLHKISEEAQNIGAVNTITFNGHIKKGYNTDYYGFGLTLDRFNVAVKNKKVVILGTGGASKAVLQCVIDRGASNITMVSRKETDKTNYITYDRLKDLESGDIIINSTPVGMYPNIDESPVTGEILAKFSTAIDLIYNPDKTEFLQLAEQNGLKVINGLYMLVAQAVKSQELWNNIKIPTTIVDEIHEEMKAFIKEKNIILIGMPGCGKSTIGKKLAKKAKIPFCDLDKYIEDKWEKPISEIFKNGEKYFREIESQAVLEVSATYPKIISTGGGVITRKENIENLKKNGIIIFINRPLEEITKDINTQKRPLLKDDLSVIKELYNQRLPLYKEYSDIEIVNDSTLDNVVNSILPLV